MKKKYLYFISCLIFFIPLWAFSSQQGIVISGTNVNTPASVDIISVSDSDRQVKTLSGILESRSGVNVTRYGTDGSYSSIYVRGTNSNQLAVYLDGIPLSDAVFGEVNFENIPLDSIERIEVYKSFAPLSFASPGIGGVVNLVTKKERHMNETGASISAGSFNTYRLSAFNSYAEDPVRLLVSGSLSSGRGDFSFNNDNGTDFNRDDDFIDRRKNNKFSSANATARFSFSDGGMTIDALSDLFAKNQGVASYNNTASSASLKTLRNLNNARVTFSKIMGLPLSEQLSIFGNIRRDTFDDLESEIGFLAEKDTGTYLSCGAGSYTTLALENIFQELSLSIQGQNEYYYLKKENTAVSESYPAQRRRTLSAGIQDSISFYNKRITIIPQVRCLSREDSFQEAVDTGVNVFSCDPQAGVIFWAVEDLLYIKGAYSRNHRAPGFAELFGNRGTVQGNPNLMDEVSRGYDASIGITNSDFSRQVIQSVNLEYSYFSTRMKNIIIFMRNSQNTMKAFNISAASITGHELTAQVTALDHLDVSCNGTLQYAIDESDIPYYRGNCLPNRPILEGGTAVKLFSRLGSISYQYSYAGWNFKDRANSRSQLVNQRAYHTVTAVLTPRFDLTLTLEIKNVADNRTQDIAGYPLPGRSFTVSVQYIF